MKYLMTRVLQTEIDTNEIPDLEEDEDPRDAAVNFSFEIPLWEWDEVDFNVETLDDWEE